MGFLKKINKEKLSIICLFFMLELLHLALWFDFGSLLSRSLFLAHFGFFLMWQPVWQQNKKFSLIDSALFISLILVSVFYMNLWLVLAWLIMLVGFIVGIFKQKRSELIIYMFTLVFLISEILIGCNTQIFEIELSLVENRIFIYGMLYPPLILFLFTPENNQGNLSVDLLGAISSSLLVSLISLGSLLIMYHNGTDYFAALVQNILAISLCLILISWLLSPKLGFSGLSQLWYQSLLNLGTPFETWLNQLYLINQEIDCPKSFIEQAMRELVAVSWISGIKWELTNNKDEFGTINKLFIPVKINDLNVTIYTHIRAGGALILHSRLLVQLIENMYTAKLHEQKLAQQAHLKNVHETGARITHDIKNLLQSLNTMTNVYSKPSLDDAKKEQLLTKQIPNVSQRLQLALNKLQTPVSDTELVLSFSQWHKKLKERIDSNTINISAEIESDQDIPFDLFDSVIDNLLENCHHKQQLDDSVSVQILLISNSNALEIHVIDSGSSIPKDIEQKLFNEITPSQSGLGIGLYQAAKQAEINGYELKLLNNKDGCIEFVLSKKL